MHSDLRIGALTLLRVCGRVQHGRNYVNIWLCQCDCERTFEIDQNSLNKGRVLACKVCRRGPCVICGQAIDNDTYSVKRNTCSDYCYKENRRQRQRESLKRRTERDPEFHKKHYQAALVRDPELNKKRYQRKLERLNAMSPTERQSVLQREYQQCNDWTTRRRAWLKAHDRNGYEQFLQIRRAAYRRHQTSMNLY